MHWQRGTNRILIVISVAWISMALLLQAETVALSLFDDWLSDRCIFSVHPIPHAFGLRYCESVYVALWTFVPPMSLWLLVLAVRWVGLGFKGRAD